MYTAISFFESVGDVTILPFRLHLLLAEYNPTFPCNPELLSSHIGLRLLEINLDLLSTLLFCPAFIGTHNYCNRHDVIYGWPL